MEANSLVAEVLAGIPRTLHVALDGATAEQLAYRPENECNTIAWLVWHLTRVQDRIISGLSGSEHLWVSGGWHAKFGRPADAADTGIGSSDDDVAAIRPDGPQPLLDYYEAVLARTREYLATLSPADLDRVIDPANPEVTVGGRLRICILDNVQHAGQAAYLRGLIERRHVYPA